MDNLQIKANRTDQPICQRCMQHGIVGAFHKSHQIIDGKYVAGPRTWPSLCWRCAEVLEGMGHKPEDFAPHCHIVVHSRTELKKLAGEDNVKQTVVA